jgi:hypothetical protein
MNSLARPQRWDVTCNFVTFLKNSVIISNLQISSSKRSCSKMIFETELYGRETGQ